MTFKKKEPTETANVANSEGPKAPRGYADSKRYASSLAAIRTLKDHIVGLEAGLEASAKEVIGIEEDRRQDAATYDFNLKMTRQAQLAEFAKQDALREAELNAREQALTAAETDFSELLNISPIAGDHLATGRALARAFNERLEQQFKSGEKSGKEASTSAYAIQKKVDEATARTDLALLTQKNEQLAKENLELKAQNKALLDAQTKTNETVAEVAKTGLLAAGGVVQKGNEALGTAAGAFPGGSRPR